MEATQPNGTHQITFSRPALSELGYQGRWISRSSLCDTADSSTSELPLTSSKQALVSCFGLPSGQPTSTSTVVHSQMSLRNSILGLGARTTLRDSTHISATLRSPLFSILLKFDHIYRCIVPI